MAKDKIPQMYGGVLTLPKPPARKASEYLTAYKSWTYTAVNAISQDVSSIDLKLYQKKFVKGEVEIEEIVEHESLSLLYYVNPFMTQQMLIEISSVYLDLIGEAYWAKLRNVAGEVEELWPLRPDWIKVQPSKEGFIDHFVYDPGGSAPKIKFPVEDIVPFKNLNPSDAYRGYGTVQASAMAIDTDDFSAEWNRSFFFNAAMPGLVFTTDKKLDQASIDRFVTDWKSKFGGASKAHKVAFLGGGFKADKLTMCPQEMDFLEQRKMMRDEILAMYRVPKSVIGITDDVNRANAQATIMAYMERVVTPRMIKMVTHLNEFFLTEWGDENLFFDFTDPSPEDVELNLKIYENALLHGWMTRNEVREKENLSPVEGGDSIYLPFSLTPIGGVIEGVKGLFGKSKDKQDGLLKFDKIGDAPKKYMIGIPPKRLRELKKDAVKSDIKRDLHKLVLHTIKEVTEDPETGYIAIIEGDKREVFWEKMAAKMDVQEDKMKQQTIQLMKEQEAEVINNLEYVKYHSTVKRKGKENNFLFDLVSENNKWKSIFSPFVKIIFIEKAREILDMLGTGNDIITTTPSAVEFLEKDGIKFINDVNTTTREALKKTLADGLENGESIPQLRDRIEDVFSIATKSRADMIARTEIARVTSYSSIEAYKQSGVVEGKEWLASPGACEICAPMDGVIVPLTSTFATEVGNLFSPTDSHPNCRCAAAPAVIMPDKQVKKNDVSEHLVAKITSVIKDKVIEKEIKAKDDKIIEKDKKITELKDAIVVTEEEHTTTLNKIKDKVSNFMKGKNE